MSRRSNGKAGTEKAPARALSLPGSPGDGTQEEGDPAAAKTGTAQLRPSDTLFIHRDRIYALLLAALTIIAYRPAWNGQTIWDDDAHITRPELRSLEGLARIWMEPGATQQYYPLAHSFFWMQHRFWGNVTLGYHLINILLHVCCALLLVKILRRLNVPGGWLAAAVFALHPVQVESVAWISELKNTLSGVLCLGAALIYLEFDGDRKWTFYAGALCLFILGLASKTVIATLPASLLVIFWWQRGRLAWKNDVLPLLPFFAIGTAAGLFTAWMERTSIGAVGSEFNFSFIERCLIAGRAIWFYLGKLFWPANLIFMYPRWNISQAAWWQYLFPVAALVLLVGLWLWRRRSRGPLAGLLIFAGTLFPALGFFNVYPFRFSFVADHYQYLAAIGPISLAVAGMTAVFGIIGNRKPYLGLILRSGLLVCLGILTWRQCGMFADVETLWQDTIRRNPECWMAHNNLGNVLLQKGNVDEAIAQYERALQIYPDFAEADNNLACVLATCPQASRRNGNRAVELAKRANRLTNDTNPFYLCTLASAYAEAGRFPEALETSQRALQLAETQSNTGLSEVIRSRMELYQTGVPFHLQ